MSINCGRCYQEGENPSYAWYMPGLMSIILIALVSIEYTSETAFSLLPYYYYVTHYVAQLIVGMRRRDLHVLI